jgi:hypothetical protein
MMKRARIGIIATAVLAVATMAFAQAKPDFSGSWTPEVDPAAAAGGGGGRGGGGPITVKQTATEISVERAGRGGGAPTTTVYKLDGSETKVTMGPNEGTATAKWDGNKLVISTKAGEFATTATWSLEGGVLTIDSTGGRGPTKRTYKKTT